MWTVIGRPEAEAEGCSALQEVRRNKRSSDAFQQVGVAVGASSAVAEFPDTRAELHGAAAPHPALRGTDRR